MRPGEAPWFEEFVLWHEFGHFETCGPAFKPQAFNSETIRKEEELSQNIFAFFGLLYSPRGHRSDDETINRLGIPEDVLQSVMDTLVSDQEFSEYVHLK
jgi:Zn-dependent peptidase ImmA (M78 family)